jgi:hypothetical protein
MNNSNKSRSKNKNVTHASVIEQLITSVIEQLRICSTAVLNNLNLIIQRIGIKILALLESLM